MSCRSRCSSWFWSACRPTQRSTCRSDTARCSRAQSRLNRLNRQSSPSLRTASAAALLARDSWRICAHSCPSGCSQLPTGLSSPRLSTGQMDYSSMSTAIRTQIPLLVLLVPLRFTRPNRGRLADLESLQTVRGRCPLRTVSSSVPLLSSFIIYIYFLFRVFQNFAL